MKKGLIGVIARHKFVVSITLMVVLFPILLAMTPLVLLLVALWTYVGISEIKEPK